MQKLDVCLKINCETGASDIFVEMSFEKARISLDYLTKDTAEIRKISNMPKANIFRKLKI